MLAQHLPQGGLQQVGGGVVAGHGGAVVLVHREAQGIAGVEGAALHGDGVKVLAGGGLGAVLHQGGDPLAGDGAPVPHLSAALGVEGGGVEDEGGLLAGGDAVSQLAARDDAGQAGHRVQLFIAHKRGAGQVQLGGDVLRPGDGVHLLPGGAGPLALLLHQLVEGRFVQADLPLGHDLPHQVDGEAEGVVELECLVPGEDGLAGLDLLGADMVEHGRCV